MISINKRQKKKQIKTRNKKLIKLYPYFLPRNVWTDKVVNGYDYTWTEYDCIPEGWKVGFGKFLLEDLKSACEKTNYADKLRFFQIKEKFGSLRLYINGAPQEVYDVISKYEFISEHVCINCGSPEAIIVDNYGWYLPLCKHCWNKNIKYREKGGYKTKSWNEAVGKGKVGLPDEYKVTRYSNGENETITYDISDTANKIRSKFEKRIIK